MGSKGPSWSDQWGSGGFGSDHYEEEEKMKMKKSGSSKKMADAKAVASAGMDKAKTAAVVGAQKVKSGTSAGLKWVKNQYQKRTSKKMLDVNHVINLPSTYLSVTALTEQILQFTPFVPTA
ncbi:hypothetical protein JHK86_033380 [Glycine max]|nr:hypothetical protein JHK86_033380 [Glycine max]